MSNLETKYQTKNQIQVLEFIKTKKKTYKTEISNNLKINYYDLTKIINQLILQNQIKVVDKYFFKIK